MENKSFSLRSKRLFLTYPRSDFQNDYLLAALEAKCNFLDVRIIEHIVARERHSDGGYHSHVYLGFNTELRQRIQADHFDVDGRHPNIESVRSPKKVAKYCKKGDDFISNMPDYAEKVTKAEVAKKLIAGTKLCDIVKDNPQYLFGYSKLKADLQAFVCDTQELAALAGPVGIWIAGPSGSGKSTIATTRMGSYYQKGQNKWWDGYAGEPTVLCEDVDITWKELFHFFKIWADRYPFIGETKGGTIKLRPTKFIITSNRALEELLELMGWPKDDYKPYTRRFRSYWITSIDDWDDQL